MKSFWLVLALIVLPVAASIAQPLPRAGRDFTFGVIEGPEGLETDTTQTELTVTITGAYEGCGIITSPSGFAEEFSFSPGIPTILRLPYYLIQVNDLGKTRKGLTLHTNEPVNVVLHDFAPSAGDASQIYPDEVLDTDYVVPARGLWNDVNEHNHVEFLVTAKDDNTHVTITPTVTTLDGGKAHVPFHVSLNRAESYIVKADTSGYPSDPSLSGSTVVSDKPISVIAGTSCAYVPIAMQSCNELMDEILGKKWWGSDFIVQPLGNLDSAYSVIVITGDRPFYAFINGNINTSQANRIRAEFFGNAEIQTFDENNNPVNVELHQYARGSNRVLYGISDPTMVTVLDVTHYEAGTMLWNVPHYGMQNWMPIVYPAGAEASIVMDGLPLSAQHFAAAPALVGTSGYMAALDTISEGVHTLTSKVPVFPLATGFAVADAYSFIPGMTAPEIPRDTAHHSISLAAEPANACETFGVTASFDKPIAASEHLLSLSMPVTYDSSTLHLIGVEAGDIGATAFLQVDSSRHDEATITVIGNPYIAGTKLYRLVFEGWKEASATSVGKNLSIGTCGDAIENITMAPTSFAVLPSTDTLTRKFQLNASSAMVCHPLTVSLLADSILAPEDRFVASQLTVNFDTSALRFLASQRSSLLRGIPINESGEATGHYAVNVTNPVTLAGSDTLLTLQFEPHAVTSTTTLSGVITYLRCGDTLTRAFSIAIPVSIIYDSTRTKLTVNTSSVSFGNVAVADLTLNSLPSDAVVNQFQLYVTYDHNVIELYDADPNGTITATWNKPVVKKGESTDTVLFTATGLGGGLTTNGMLSHLLFKTYVTDTTGTPIEIASSLPGTENDCPTIFSAPIATTSFTGKELCGDSLFRALMEGKQIRIEDIHVTGGGATHIQLTVDSPKDQDVTFTVVDILGRTVWQETVHVKAGSSSIDATIDLPKGAYILRMVGQGRVQSKKMVVLN